MQRRVHRVKGQVKQERLVLVPRDERDGFASEGIGQILFLLDHLRPSVDRCPLAGEVRVPAREESEVLIEPAPRWVKPRRHPLVPLADEPRHISGGLEPVRQGCFRQGQADIDVIGFTGIELVPEPLLISARQEPGPGRTAIRARDIAVRAAHAVFGQRVDVRSGNVGASLKTHVGVSHVIGQDDEDVRPGSFGRDARRSEGEHPHGQAGDQNRGRGEIRRQAHQWSLQVSAASVGCRCFFIIIRLLIQVQLPPKSKRDKWLNCPLPLNQADTAFHR